MIQDAWRALVGGRCSSRGEGNDDDDDDDWGGGGGGICC